MIHSTRFTCVLNTCAVILLFGIAHETSGQSRVISGKVIGSEFRHRKSDDPYEFWELYHAKIFYNDSLLLGTADARGEFRLALPEGADKIEIGWVGMYPGKFLIMNDCDYLEVILLPDAIYDFVTLKKAERLRRKDRAILPELYREAFKQGIFRQEVPCR